MKTLITEELNKKDKERPLKEGYNPAPKGKKPPPPPLPQTVKKKSD